MKNLDRDAVLAGLDDERRIAVQRSLIKLLGPRDAIALQQLRWHCDHDGYVDITADEIADEVGLSRDQAKRALARLVDDGIVTWEEPDRFSRRRRYRIAAFERADSHLLDGAAALSLLTQDVEEQLVTAPDAFEAFWSDYPRKVGKPDARKVFMATLKERPQPDIAAGLERWLAYWRANGDIDAGRFTPYVPHPATWLRGRRWEVETPVPQARQNGANRARQARPETITERSGESGLIDL